MTFYPADNLSLIAFTIFCVLMFGLIVFAFSKAQVAKRFYVIYAAYILALSALVVSGVVRANVIPAVPLLFVSLIFLSIWLAFSSAGAQVANCFSFIALVGFQFFRLPLELILHRWVEMGTIPETMTWTGQNWDIITGFFALFFMAFANRSRTAVWVFQIIGFGLLINVLRVVIMSSPFPFSWNLENPLQLALYFPYVLIAPLFVAPALFGHLVVFRKLMGRV